MFERFKFGSYRIDEDSELASKKIKSKSSSSGFGQVLVKFLDNSNVKFSLDVSIAHRGKFKTRSNQLYIVEESKRLRTS
jgi:hypothetical protein